MDNRWSDSLRQKMEHHGETPPEGLWDAIERGMDRRAEALSRRRRRMFWSIGSGAAAAVVALLLLIDLGGTTGDPADRMAADPVVDPVTGRVVAEPVAADPVVERAVDAVADTVADAPRAVPATIHDMIPEPIFAVIPEAVPEVTLDTIPEATPDATPETIPKPEPRRERPDYEQYMATDTPPAIRPRKSREQGKWQTGLYASNSSMSGSRSNKDFGLLNDAGSMFADALQSDVSNSYLATSTSSPKPPSQFTYELGNRSVFNNVKHHLPVTVGVSVGRGLGKRWSLTGGLTYTRLASTFKTSGGLYSGSYEQVLHYIGIPLDVRFDLWRSASGFSVYLSAGGQAAKNVGGRVTANGVAPSGADVLIREGSVTDPRLRWSVRGSAGVGYDFIPGVGLYVEPGVDYHFDNGSRVVTVWKDRPLNFGLRLGLRVSL